MSLSGDLEDLPLLDILQMVSFSKKTGLLAIHAPSGEAGIVFREGLLVAAFSWDSPPLDPRARSLSEERRAEMIRGRINLALAQLIRLREAPFHFAVGEEVAQAVGSRDISGETLEQGLNVQNLLLDLTRGMDEDRRDSSAALEAAFAGPREPAFDAGFHPRKPQTILLVDDEPEARAVLARAFAEAGYLVLEAEDPETAVKKARSLAGQGTAFLLVADLGMPTSGGSSFQGGFEVVKRLGKLGLHPPALLMSERLSETLQARARQMGVSGIVFKPGLSKLEPEQFEADLRAFAQELLKDTLPRLVSSTRPAPRAPRQPPKKAARAESVPEAPPEGPPGPPEPSSRQLGLLQWGLEELRRQGDPMRVSSLILRAAREFFERGVLLLVKDDALRGLGGYGAAPSGESLNLLVRDIVIPLGKPSLFRDAFLSRKPGRGSFPGDEPSRLLLSRIGPFKSRSFVLLPLVAHRETIALLFLDNPETGKPARGLDVLEVFLNQAGIVLENAFLQRKVRALQERE